MVVLDWGDKVEEKREETASGLGGCDGDCGVNQKT